MGDQLTALLFLRDCFWKVFACKFSLTILASMIMIFEWKRDIDTVNRYNRFVNREILNITQHQKNIQYNGFGSNIQFLGSQYSGLLKYLWTLHGPVKLTDLPRQQDSIWEFIYNHEDRMETKYNIAELSKCLKMVTTNNKFYKKSLFF